LWSRCCRCFLVLFFALFIGVLLVAARSALAAGVEDASRGELLLRARTGGVYHSAVQLEGRAQLQISGMIAQVVLEQRFRNDSSEWMEGIYVFPLPERAAVNQLRLVIAERIIVGKIRERAEAEAVYRKARQEGRKASLVEQQRHP
jgi:Ca-activated chloride channel family protein